MAFGGHETFSIREGWLHKGLTAVRRNQGIFADPFAGDVLGVGRNMAKSIRYWLKATGLAELQPLAGSGVDAALAPTTLGELVLERDPFFLELGTWWAVHCNLATNATDAFAWSWFFNQFELRRFDRAVCNEALRNHTTYHLPRPPKPATLQREVACLLSSYARVIPPEHNDPEEASICPLTELGLVHYFRSSGYYQLEIGPKEVPPELFCYAIGRMSQLAGMTSGPLAVPLRDITLARNSPGRLFCLNAEQVFDAALTAERELGAKALKLEAAAGERVVRLTGRRGPEQWLKDYYQRLRKAA